jgi:hypothetical protein
VKHRPICTAGANRTQDLWADLGQPLHVACDVTAVPAVESWWWTLNTSRQLDKLPGRAGPRLTYTPHTERDFGLLACWAANSEGRMASPCTFLVRRALAPPAAAEENSGRQVQQQQQLWSGLDCSLHNQTLTSLIVSCIWEGQREDFESGGGSHGGGGGPRDNGGGAKRFYYLEVREKEGGELVQNLTAGKESTTETSSAKNLNYRSII